MNKKLYKELEISENANASEIKKAYRKLAKKYHPDINKEQSAEEKFKSINFAYEVLSDEKQKRQYDMYGDSLFEKGNTNQQQGFSQQGMDINDIFESMFSGVGSFSQGFGGRQEIDLDIEATLEVPITLIKEGGSMPLKTNMGNFTIKIKKDLKENDKIKVKGKGQSYNNKTGDLYLYVKVVGDNEWEVNEIDLYKIITLPLKTAMFGGEIEKEYFNKEKLKIKIPENIEYGKKIRVRKKGFYDKRFNEPGDLYLVVNIEIPKISTLSKTVKEVLQSDLTEEVVEKNKNFFDKMKNIFN